MKTIEIELTKGFKAVIDVDDYERVAQFKWRATVRNTVVYAGRGWREGVVQKHQYLHRFVMGDPDGLVDHIDGNGLNCSKSNLRVVTHSQNSMNRGRHAKGYRLHKGSWHAHISINGKQIHLGVFDTEDEAKAARKGASRVLFGDFDARDHERAAR